MLDCAITSYVEFSSTLLYPSLCWNADQQKEAKINYCPTGDKCCSGVCLQLGLALCQRCRQSRGENVFFICIFFFNFLSSLFLYCLQ